MRTNTHTHTTTTTCPWWCASDRSETPYRQSREEEFEHHPSHRSLPDLPYSSGLGLAAIDLGRVAGWVGIREGRGEGGGVIAIGVGVVEDDPLASVYL